MPYKLPHYLRAMRRKSGLTQHDVAALLGDATISRVSRYERHRRLPALPTALAYEAVFGRPVAELFGGIADQVRAEVGLRAAALRSGLSGYETPKQAMRKRSIDSILAA